MQSDDLITLLLCLNSEESAGLLYKVESHHIIIIISDLADADAVTRNENLGLSVSQSVSQAASVHCITTHCTVGFRDLVPYQFLPSLARLSLNISTLHRKLDHLN